MRRTTMILALGMALVNCTANAQTSDRERIPSFINAEANHIITNGADLERLQNAFANSDNSRVSIVLIGDSHVQPDVAGAETRRLLQADYGNAGRGVISPLRITGTNQPSDYTFSSPNQWRAVKIMRNWFQTLGFTGASIHPVAKKGSFTLATKKHPFTEVTIFHDGALEVTGMKDDNGGVVLYETVPGDGHTLYKIEGDPLSEVTINFDSEGDLLIFGASLTNGGPGLVYNTIGNNGAQYRTYNKIGTMGKGVAQLQPDLVIISMGSNEACDTRIYPERFAKNIDQLVSDIKQYSPNAVIMLTTPKEFQQGGRINSNIPDARDVIMKYCAEHNMPVYDWFTISGGKGASSKWLSGGYLSGDKIHNTAKGYRLYGQMLYDALSEILKK